MRLSALFRKYASTARSAVGLFSFVLVAFTGLQGCVTATVEQVRQGATGIGEHESVVLLGRRHQNGYETEEGFVKCVGGHLRNVKVTSEHDFMDGLYPWFEPRVAPLEANDLPNLLNRPAVQRKIQSTGIRYLVWVDGSTNTGDSSGTLTCTISPGGGGCFGFVTWERDSAYEASIWDLKTGTQVGRISSAASGTSYMPAVVVPIPLIARVQASACNGLARQLESFLLDAT
ncbi:MAG: hypothetical protein V3U43_10155 [Pseudomonadales bacterium]